MQENTKSITERKDSNRAKSPTLMKRRGSSPPRELNTHRNGTKDQTIGSVENYSANDPQQVLTEQEEIRNTPPKEASMEDNMESIEREKNESPENLVRPTPDQNYKERQESCNPKIERIQKEKSLVTEASVETDHDRSPKLLLYPHNSDALTWSQNEANPSSDQPEIKYQYGGKRG